MAENITSLKTLNHFTLIKFTQAFWELEPAARGRFFEELETALSGTAACAYFYQVSPLNAGADALLWTALPVAQTDQSAAFFTALAAVFNARRQWIEIADTLWGFTKPSQYSRGNSSQEIDPLQPARQTYLIAYPFIKTAEWYLLSRDTRQGMMNQHIRIGHQYPEIKQLLLYSFGLQDQEFVVVYETEDLNRFSDLVNELRGSEARRYTQRDTPVYTAVWRTGTEMSVLYGGK